MLERFGPKANDVHHDDIEAAVKYATRENLTLALERFSWFTYPNLLDGLAGRGFLPLVHSLHERDLECSTNAMDEAAANGHLKVVQFLHLNRTEGCTVDALDGAIRNGHLDVVRFLLEHRTEGTSPSILDAAAANGHFYVVQYLHSLGTFDCTVGAVDAAASAGHCEVVQFLLSNRDEGCSRDKVVEMALANGHLRTAQHLLSLGYPFPTTEICLEAWAFRKPEMVHILRLFDAHKTPWDAYAMEKACAANNVPLVRFLHAHAVTCCHPDALFEAFANEAMDVVRFLLAHCVADVSVDALQSAVRGGHLAIAMQLLQRHPELRDDDLLAVASSSHLTEATRILLAAGIGKPRKCLIEIAGYRNHVSESKLLLPYCMHAINHLDNIVFLLDLLALPNRRRETMLQLITQEMIYQGRMASQRMQLPPSMAARASTLLQSGNVLDGALALVICHLWATDATTTMKQLKKKTSLVSDAKLQTQLMRLLSSKRRRFSDKT